jgi:hypothetical protein
LTEPKVTSAKDVVAAANRAATGGSESSSIETVSGTGTPAADQPAPRSDSPLDNGAAANGSPVDNSVLPAAQPAANELTPNAAPDPNELKPNVAAEGNQPPAPPQQVNEIQQANADGSAPAQAKADDSTSQDAADDSYVSSSKKKKKKGLHKVVPF